MFKTLTIAAAIAVTTTLLTVGAGALPLAPVKQGVDNNFTLVRDGCGHGMRFSNSRDRCVEKYGRSERFRQSYGSDREQWRHRRHYRSDGDVADDVIHGIFGGGRRHRD